MQFNIILRNSFMKLIMVLNLMMSIEILVQDISNSLLIMFSLESINNLILTFQNKIKKKKIELEKVGPFKKIEVFMPVEFEM